LELRNQAWWSGEIESSPLVNANQESPSGQRDQLQRLDLWFEKIYNGGYYKMKELGKKQMNDLAKLSWFYFLNSNLEVNIEKILFNFSESIKEAKLSFVRLSFLKIGIKISFIVE
jgi:hypothetical protein